MNQEIYHHLKSQPKLLSFVRDNPMWYRYLSRDPLKINELPNEAKVYYGHTFSQRIARVNEQIQMLGMLAAFAKGQKD